MPYCQYIATSLHFLRLHLFHSFEKTRKQDLSSIFRVETREEGEGEQLILDPFFFENAMLRTLFNTMPFERFIQASQSHKREDLTNPSVEHADSMIQ